MEFNNTSAEATISVHSALSGQVVETISVTGKGHKEIELDLQDQPSGIYIYRLVIDGIDQQSDKIVLIK